MRMIKKKPPPLIDSAKLLFFAYNDIDVKFTDKIDLFVGKIGDLTRLGEMPCIAICSNFVSPKNILLFFCNTDWSSEGAISFKTIDEAKNKAEKGYRGISAHWKKSPYSKGEIDDYIREVYGVDPETDWWE